MKLLVNEMGYANPMEAKVYLNGIEQKNAISLDTKLRTLTRYKTHSNGQLVQANGIVKTETISGHIKVVFESE